MEIVLTIPDQVAADLQMGDARPLARRALELIAIDGYKSGQLTHAEVGQMLGLETPIEVDGFLKDNGVYNVDYTEDELVRESESGRRLAGLLHSVK